MPGKNPKPPKKVHREQLWRCLLHGVGQAHPSVAKAMSEQGECFSLIAWNPIYYNCYKSIEADLPWIDLLIQKEGPSERDIREVLSWRNKIAKLLQNIADRFPWLIDLLPDPAVKASIKETARYFENRNDIAHRIREMLKDPLRQAFERNERVLLIGHSMGSIIAYDSLWELWHLEKNRGRVDCFISIGSPLGMHFVQKRLKGLERQEARSYPGNIAHWKNISAHGDLVALDETLHDDYKEMLKTGLIESIEDHFTGVFNYFRNEKGLNVHRSYGYLVNPSVGKIIADWWVAHC